MSELKKTKIKGIVVMITAIFLVISYVIVVLTFRNYGIMLHTLYDTSTSIGISILTGISFTMVSRLVYRCITLSCCVFYGISAISALANLLNIFPAISLGCSLITSIIVLLIYLAYAIYHYTKRPS